MARQKAKRAESAQRAAAVSAAEAVAVGTMAGGLVIGAAEGIKQARADQQAHDRQPAERDSGTRSGAPDEGDKVAANARAHEIEDRAGQQDGVMTADVARSSPEPTDVSVSQQTASAAPSAASETPIAAPDAPATGPGSVAEVPSEASALPMVDGSSEQPAQVLAARIADQITSGLERIVDGLGAGVSPATLGQELASQITHTVNEVISGLDGLGNNLPSAASIAALAADPQDVTAMVDGVLDGALSSVDDLAAQLDDQVEALAPTLDDLTTLPVTLLGAEGLSSPSGLLEGLFYRDGEDVSAPAMAQPIELPEMVVPAAFPSTVAELSEMAMDSVAPLVPVEIGFIGQSYASEPDGSSPLVNALHLM